MKDDLKKFFSIKRNVVMVVLIGVTILFWILSAFLSVMALLSCVMTGVLCLDIAYILFLKYVKKKNSRVDEFLQEEKDLKTKVNQFVDSESKMNLLLLIVMCVIMGLVLIYYGFKMFIV